MAQEAQRATAAPVGSAAARDGAGDDSPRRWLILGVVCLAQLMVVLDATVVNIALPVAQHDLGFNNADRQWVVTAYSLAFGGLLLLGGRLSDLVGRKRMLILGIVGFALASALGGAAQNFTMLLIARAVQGAFGAMLAPAALSTLTVTFTNPAERGKAFGIFGAIAGAGGAIGLLLGGVLTEYLSWRWCLYVNVIFSVIAVAAAIRLLRRDQRDPNVHLDLPGTVLVVAGLVAFVYGLAEAETKGWGAPLTIGLLVGGVVLLALFALTERRVAHPLLPLRIVLDRFRGGAYLAIGLSAIGLFGVFLFLTYYLEEVLRYSPVVTGVAFLPLIGGLVVSSTTSSQLLMPRFGPRILIPVGLLLAAGGMVILASQLGVNTNYAAWILPGLIIVGLGLGLVFGCGLNTATYGADAADAGVASAMVNTCQQVGGSIGTALLNTIAASALSSYLLTHGTSPAAQAGGGGAQLRGRVLGLRRDLRRLRRHLRAGAEVGHSHPEADRQVGRSRRRLTERNRRRASRNIEEHRGKESGTMTSDQARLVTVSASYGAGGSVVAPALADRLGVPFLQRATTSAGAMAAATPCVEPLTTDEAKLTPPHWLLARLTSAMPAGPTQSPPPSDHHEANLRRHCEADIRRLADAGAGVILGRGAAVVLGKGRGFHLRLDGPAELRVVQGAAIEGISEDEARRHLDAADRARDVYVRRLYRADPADPRHYHLVIDSTALPLTTVTELILRALASSPAQVRPRLAAQSW